MDTLFKALADPARRAILDALRARDGQTLGELEARFEMSRFGVMKHLRVLEEAHLVTTHKRGRFKHHYLNALPLQEMADRWIEPLLARPTARAILDLKSTLEGDQAVKDATTATAKPDFIHQTFIRTDPDTLWAALTDGEMTRRYYIAGARLEGRVAPGERLVYRTPDGAEMLAGEVVASEPPTRLELTFEPQWGAARATSRMVYLIEPAGALTKLTIAHYGLPEGQDGVKEGWVRVASALKTLLETGAPLDAAC